MKKKKSINIKNKAIGAYVTQPISQPDKRQKNTQVALPDEENVKYNKDWVDNNPK